MDNVMKAKQGFEASFAESILYDRQTQDLEHLKSILNTLNIQDGNRILDLGTGSGYLAFSIALKVPKATITGLDIVTNTLERNRFRAREQDIKNIEFIEYDGVSIPFEDNFFDWVVSRYALHHFPNIQDSFKQIAKILKPGGMLFISDPTPHCTDVTRFVDGYMKLKDDGHNKFYTSSEFEQIADKAGLKFLSSYNSTICFARNITKECSELLAHTTDNIKQVYNIEVMDEECYITEDVLNMTFIK